MTRPRYSLAKRRATELLAKFGISKPPVPVDKVASNLGATIRYEPFSGELSGLVHRASTGVLIGVNATHSGLRQRFTIAHEIGHLVLHQNETFHVDEHFPINLRSSRSSKAVDPMEIEANQFAAELLMPTEMLAADVHGIDLGEDPELVAKRLAKRYEVSEQAMTIRLTALGLLR